MTTASDVVGKLGDMVERCHIVQANAAVRVSLLQKSKIQLCDIFYISLLYHIHSILTTLSIGRGARRRTHGTNVRPVNLDHNIVVTDVILSFM